jgi:iron complex transport system permease protein
LSQASPPEARATNGPGSSGPGSNSAGRTPAIRPGAVLLLVLGLAIALVLAAIHLTQGSADVGPTDLLRLLAGGHDTQDAAVLVASRLPRLVAGVLVGVALGVSGMLLQTISRNILASPDTLGVNAGAYLAVVAVTAFGIHLPILAGGGIAFLGGLAAAALVLALSAGGGTGTIRLVLAGSAIALALGSASTVLLLLFPERTMSLFAWGQGTIAQTGFGGIAHFGPVVIVALLLTFAFARGLDLLSLGDDTASVLGLNVRRTQLVGILIAVALSAAAVTIAGPIGFVGLAAPAIARLIAAHVPGMQRHIILVPASAIVGIIVVLGADVLLRLVFGGAAGAEVPTGVVTTIFGAIFLVVLALRLRASSDSAGRALVTGRTVTRRYRVILILIAGVLLLAVMFGSLLLGDTKLLAGDLVNWVSGRAGPIVSFVLETRAPRVFAAALAGAALALAGAIVQAVSRNPLAESSIIGVTGGAGLGAVFVITLWPVASFVAVTGGGLAGAAITAIVVFGLAARGGFASNRLILIGLGVSAAASAGVSMLIVATDPYNGVKALTWLSGSTYGRTFGQLIPLTIVLVLAIPVLLSARRELDLLAFDDDTPRVLGIRIAPARLILLTATVVLTAAAVSAVGVIGFVGLVAPHAARALVGARHSAVLPLSALLGAILVCVADTLGRTIIAPNQLPAGLLTAVVGAPYFVWLLWRSRQVV